MKASVPTPRRHRTTLRFFNIRLLRDHNYAKKSGMKFPTIHVLTALLGTFLFVLFPTTCTAQEEQPTAVPSPSPTKTITFKGNEDASGNPEECRARYREYKNAYLRYVERPHHTDFLTSFKDCFRKCCFSPNFECKSFSYFRNTRQCFLMNVTQHDDGVVLAYSQVHVHIELDGENSETEALSASKPHSSSPQQASVSPRRFTNPVENDGPESGTHLDKKESDGYSRDAVVETDLPTKMFQPTYPSNDRKQKQGLRAETTEAYSSNSEDSNPELGAKSSSKASRWVVSTNIVKLKQSFPSRSAPTAVEQDGAGTHTHKPAPKTSKAQISRETTGVPEGNMFTKAIVFKMSKPTMRQRISITPRSGITTETRAKLRRGYSIVQVAVGASAKSAQASTQSTTRSTISMPTDVKAKPRSTITTSAKSTITERTISIAMPRTTKGRPMAATVTQGAKNRPIDSATSPTKTKSTLYTIESIISTSLSTESTTKGKNLMSIKNETMLAAAKLITTQSMLKSATSKSATSGLVATKWTPAITKSTRRANATNNPINSARSPTKLNVAHSTVKSMTTFTHFMTKSTNLMPTKAETKQLSTISLSAKSTTTHSKISSAKSGSRATILASTAPATPQTIATRRPINSANSTRSEVKFSTTKGMTTTTQTPTKPYRTTRSTTRNNPAGAQLTIATKPSVKTITGAPTAREPTTTPSTTTGSAPRKSRTRSTSTFPSASSSTTTAIKASISSMTAESATSRTIPPSDVETIVQPYITRFISATRPMTTITTTKISVTPLAEKTSESSTPQGTFLVMGKDLSVTNRKDDRGLIPKLYPMPYDKEPQTTIQKRGSASATEEAEKSVGVIRDSKIHHSSCITKCSNGGTCRVTVIAKTLQREEFCECPKRYQGEWCEIAPAAAGVFSWWVVALVVVAVIITVCGVGAYMAYIIYRQRNMIGKYKVSNKGRFEARSMDTLDEFDRMASYSTSAWNQHPYRNSWMSSGTFSTAASV